MQQFQQHPNLNLKWVAMIWHQFSRCVQWMQAKSIQVTHHSGSIIQVNYIVAITAFRRNCHRNRIARHRGFVSGDRAGARHPSRVSKFTRNHLPIQSAKAFSENIRLTTSHIRHILEATHDSNVGATLSPSGLQTNEMKTHHGQQQEYLRIIRILHNLSLQLQ